MDIESMRPERRNLTIEQILRAEWAMFGKVESIGGRAACQEDWPTFRIMRYAYYDAWTDGMLKSYMRDLEEAEASGRNLVAEKYAHMMAYTDPAYFREKLAPYLPAADEETSALIDEIAAFLVCCEKNFAAKYPKISGRGRPAAADMDSGSMTSAETYARGELRTYSKPTLRLFGAYVRQCLANGTNLSMRVKERMVRMYGYDSLDDAESKL